MSNSNNEEEMAMKVMLETLSKANNDKFLSGMVNMWKLSDRHERSQLQETNENARIRRLISDLSKQQIFESSKCRENYNPSFLSKISLRYNVQISFWLNYLDICDGLKNFKKIDE